MSPVARDSTPSESTAQGAPWPLRDLVAVLKLVPAFAVDAATATATATTAMRSKRGVTGW